MGEPIPIERTNLLAERIGYFTACWLDKVGETERERGRERESERKIILKKERKNNSNKERNTE